MKLISVGICSDQDKWDVRFNFDNGAFANFHIAHKASINDVVAEIADFSHRMILAYWKPKEVQE